MRSFDPMSPLPVKSHLADDSAFRAALRAWYRRHARALPWRGTRDPYPIWVSEVMLQQTRVAAARPYYDAFLRRFPDLPALAAAPLDDVLAAWSGLGYYRRARHLHQAARLVVRDHGGRVPSDPATFGRLPGVGRYTSGAVLSIAFDRPLPVLDGNVARVLSRLHALRVSIRDPRGARALWELASSLVPMRRPGDWNQALMELGATVCAPSGPRCDACPIRRWCRGFASGRPESFPAAPRRRSVERVRRAVALVESRGRVLLARRSGALLDGFWEPPGVELTNGGSPRRALAAELRRLGVRARLEPAGRVIRHVITHRAIEVEVWRGRGAGRLAAGAVWHDGAASHDGARTRPLTALAKKLLATRAASGTAASRR
jgi:A/G-specific adenine glycosylase